MRSITKYDLGQQNSKIRTRCDQKKLSFIWHLFPRLSISISKTSKLENFCALINKIHNTCITIILHVTKNSQVLIPL
jgi:hypothetical protein